MSGSPVEPFDSPEDAHDFVDAAEQCLAHEATITNITSSLYSQYLAEEEIQTELNTMLAEYEMVYDLIQFDSEHNMAACIETVADLELLSKAEAEAIENLWTEIEWIVDAFPAVELDKRGYRYWTDTDPSIVSDGDHDSNLVVTQHLEWGTDDVFDIEVPLSVYCRQLHNQLNDIRDELRAEQQRTVGSFVDTEEYQQTRYRLRELIDICYHIDDVISDFRIQQDPDFEGEVFTQSPETAVAKELASGHLEPDHLRLEEETIDTVAEQSDEASIREALIAEGTDD